MIIPTDNRSTYVYDSVEVVKTSRTASKNLSSGKKDLLIEITPAASTTGTWKKWVREIDLYEIDPVMTPNKLIPRGKFLEDAFDD
jgi:hypothetical protein